MSRLTIEASTPLCLLQDAGRFGVRHLGVTQGGAADWDLSVVNEDEIGAGRGLDEAELADIDPVGRKKR